MITNISYELSMGFMFLIIGCVAKYYMGGHVAHMGGKEELM
jgi:hypothetical protein